MLLCGRRTLAARIGGTENGNGAAPPGSWLLARMRPLTPFFDVGILSDAPARPSSEAAAQVRAAA